MERDPTERDSEATPCGAGRAGLRTRWLGLAGLGPVERDLMARGPNGSEPVPGGRTCSSDWNFKQLLGLAALAGLAGSAAAVGFACPARLAGFAGLASCCCGRPPLEMCVHWAQRRARHGARDVRGHGEISELVGPTGRAGSTRRAGPARPMARREAPLVQATECAPNNTWRAPRGPPSTTSSPALRQLARQATRWWILRP